MIDVVELIPSRDMRAALRARGRAFSDREKATVVFNLGLPIEKRRGFLQELAAETEDADLRAQIEFSLDVEQQALERFRRKEPGYAFGVQLIDPSEPDESGMAAYFSNFDAAYNYATFSDAAFWIRKWRLYDSFDLDDITEGRPEYGDELAALRFRGGGVLDRLDVCDEETAKERGRRWPRGTFFEDRWVDLPNPFEHGSVVRVLHKRRIPYAVAYDWGVVNVDRAEWERTADRIRSWLKRVESGKEEPGVAVGRWGHTGLAVEVPCVNGTFEAVHVNPMFLEEVEPGAEGTKEEAELLQMAVRAARGECSLYWMSKVFRKNFLIGCR